MVYTILKIAAGVYFAAVNVYAFNLMRLQKKANEDNETCGRVSDGKIFLSAVLGGALGTYVSMFIMRYKMKNLLFMVFMPVLAVVDIYVLVYLYVNNLQFTQIAMNISPILLSLAHLS